MGIARYLSKLASGLSSEGVIPTSRGGTGTTSGASGGPKISSIEITNSSYVTIDDTAVDVTGGYIKIIGTGFAAGCQVLVNTASASSVTFVSATEVRAQLPATAAGTYIVYLVNADGGTAIRVNGVTFSATPTWTTTSPLAGAVDQLISIQLAATGASTFSLASGSSLPAGVSLSSSGLLTGTVTGITLNTTYNFTIVATDPELQDSPKAFVFDISVGDTYFNQVSLLLSANADTFIKDASSNNFNLTPIGDTLPSNFSPYEPGYYSNYFDGTGDYLTAIGNTAFNPGTQDFTIECWVYRQTTDATNRKAIATTRPISGTLTGWVIFVETTGYVGLGGWNSAGTLVLNYVSTTNPIVNNVWTHVAVVKVDNSFTIYMNGVASGTGTASFTLADGPNFYLGTEPQVTTRDWNGYISNFRIVKGTAVYTANFTPATQPLTAIAGTSLLTCQGNRFVDSSTNSFAITRAGDTYISSFVPFVPSSSYTAYGSAYFDGTGDYVTVPASTSFQFTGDFTVEGWMYFNNIAGTSPQVLFGVKSGTTEFDVRWYTNRWQVSLNAGSGSDIGATPAPVNKAWNHVACVRSGSTIKLYVNGVATATTLTNSSTLGQTASIASIAASNSGGNIFNGYISDLRVVKGTAVYTSNFTPPTQPLTAISNTGLLTLRTNQPANNNMCLDMGTSAVPVTRVGNATQGTFSPFGAKWSAFFDGNGDSLTYIGGSSISFGTGDFTIETWAFLANTGTFSAFLRPDDNGVFPEWGYDFSTSQLKFQARSGAIVEASTSMPVNQWVHIAVSRSGTSLRQFINGTQVGSTTTNSSNFVSTPNAIRIGGSAFSAGHSVNGYLSNFRIINGTALYTTTFTPSITPLTAITNTSLLTCADNRFVDDSTNNYAITRVGDVKIQRFGPFTAGYSTSTIGGSVYFDGNGDRLTIPYTVLLSQQTAYTLEFWFYPTYNFTGQYLLGRNAGGYFGIGWNGTTGLLYVDKQGVGTQITATTALPLNAWHHVAMTYDGTTTRLFANGILQGSVAGTGGESSADTTIGYYAANTSSSYGGYISNFRIVRGTPLYTSAFTPPTAPLTAIANTSLLISATGAGVVDSAMQSSIETVGDAKISAAQSKFGGSSMFFDGTGDYLKSFPTAVNTFGTGNFTVEMWLYPQSATGYQCILLIGTTNPYVFFGINTGSTGTPFMWNDANVIVGSQNFTLNTWQHWAIVRNNGTVTMYLNGNSIGSATYSGNLVDNTGVYIGANSTGGQPYVGYIDDLRITRGYARYTANFTPPTVAHLTQ